MPRSRTAQDPNPHRTLFELDHAKLERSLRNHVAKQDFPCVGAKSAMAQGSLRILSAWSLASAWDDLKIHRELMDWSAEYRKDPSGLRSLAVVFREPEVLGERQFEKLMWERLQSLADKDGWLGQPYDPKVSTDPDDPHFSMSFGGQGYFVVGLHSKASRPARRSAYPTLVFNLHEQFEQLRAENRYERMRERIIERDIALAGSPNPMLSRHGEVSEARQYSGRRVEAGWECPFRDPRGS